MGRFDLTDKEWRRIEPICPRGRGRKGHHSDTRRFIDAVLYRLRVGMPWRDLPPDYGNWHTIYVRCMDWCRRGIWQRIFEVLAARPSLATVSLDSTFVRCHRAAHGAAKKTGRSPLGTVAAVPPRRCMRPSTAKADPRESG